MIILKKLFLSLYLALSVVISFACVPALIGIVILLIVWEKVR